VPFSTIIGHHAAVDLLRRAVVQQRVPQSLLIAGPEGVGKRALAMALAQAVNCKHQVGGDACGTCSNCVRIAKNQFSDVTVVELADEASIKIKAIRERIVEPIGYRPFEGARRVSIIDPADAMTREAQDALLKTLEEPPASAMLMLVSAYPDTLLPTIQSRCRRLRVGLLSDADVARVLVERQGVAAAQARMLAAAAGGRVAAALSAQAGPFEGDRDAALSFITAQRGPLAGRLKAAASLTQHGSKRRDRDALGSRLSIVQSLLRDLAALGVGGHVPLANADLTAELAALTTAYPLERLNEAFALVTRADAALDRYASPKIVADWLAVSL
jgi:DNA polymerase III subunit delta'